MPFILLIIYCVLILAASLAGGWIPIVVRLTHRRLQIAASLVAGVMLGVGMLHMLPHALLEAPDAPDLIFIWMLLGFLIIFFIERFFSFHHHDAPHDNNNPQDDDSQDDDSQDDDSQDDDPNAHGGHEPRADEHGVETRNLTWGGAAVGLSLHTVIAGVALAASVEVESGIEHMPMLAGLGTFLVIFLHKPFDSMTLTTLMSVGGWSTFSKHVVNGVFALMVPLGVILFYLGFRHAEGGSQMLGCALAFSAGTFLCIAASDLLPELQFHRHDRVALSVALLLGLSVAWVVAVIEKSNHGRPHGPLPVQTLPVQTLPLEPQEHPHQRQ